MDAAAEAAAGHAVGEGGGVVLFGVAGELGHFDGISFADLISNVVLVCSLVDEGDLVNNLNCKTIY